MTDKKMKARVERTKRLMHAGKELRDYRDRIDDILTAINSGQDFHSDLADEVISIGVSIQSLSKILRPLSVEGKAKKIKRDGMRKWKRMREKMMQTLDHEDFVEWLEKHSEKFPKSKHLNNTEYSYYGPNEDFFATYVASDKDNT